MRLVLRPFDWRLFCLNAHYQVTLFNLRSLFLFGLTSFAWLLPIMLTPYF